MSTTAAHLFIFARFHARADLEEGIVAALRDTVVATRTEPGCVAIAAFRSVRDPRLFWIHSCFVDEAAFETHAELPHTVHFLDVVQPLIDHPLDVMRTQAIV